MSAVNNLVDNLRNMSLEKWGPMYWATQACPVLNSPVDWKETEKAHVFMVDLPGVKKEEVKVEVDQGRVLEISGDRGGVTDHEESGNDGGVWHRVERARGKFLRRFRLPENAKVDEVKAEMENGVLKVVVPKQEVKRVENKVIEIEEK